MRFRIVKTLLYKEALRHATNRGGLVLAALLITASLLLAVLNPGGERSSPLIGGLNRCYLVYDDETNPWVQHMLTHVPPNLEGNLERYNLRVNRPDALPDKPINYPTGTAAIEIRTVPNPVTGGPQQRVYVRYPAGDRSALGVFENWFWRETRNYFQTRASDELKKLQLDPERYLPASASDDLWSQRQAYEDLRNRFLEVTQGKGEPLPILEFKESAQKGSTLDLRAAIATALVMFSLCFTCIYLMPSLTCEERERGLLLAQALSPASPFEILMAKFLFYPGFGILLATLLAGIHNPNVLSKLFFWLALGALAVGTLGIGMTIACLARTQRAASLAALCYMLTIALVLLICQQNNLTKLPLLAIEYHAPHILHASLTDQLRSEHWLHLGACTALSLAWGYLAVTLFRTRGWQ
ncbi:MAG: ABC transporter permease [Gemmataceae bacterium]|nr:ABC transporter permease [Gemmataceae bacterium]